MEYGLSRFVHDSDAFLSISEEEYHAITEAKEDLFKILFVEEKFDLVVENYLELETCFLDSAAQHMVRGIQDYEWSHCQRRLFNRRLANLLSACRSYCDYTKKIIPDVLSDTVGAAARLETVFASHRETNFSYRFMEQLRNSVQHHGFPIHTVAYTSGWEGKDDDSRLVYGISIYAESASLQEDGKFDKCVLRTIDELGGSVDIKLHAREYVATLSDAHEQLREMTQRVVEAWDAKVLGAIERFRSAYPNESTAVGVVVVQREGQAIKGPVRIFDGFIKYRKALQLKNGSLVNLGKRFVTGAAQRKDIKKN